ncbi:iron complex outermembrane recepter protein [Sphingomonas sp. F9_3S_D5_B_2]
MRFEFVRAALCGSVAAIAFCAVPAAAQQNPSTSSSAPSNAQTQDAAAAGSDQEIVVTARRRSELLLNVPVAVTAYSGEQLDRQGALDITDVADTTPNVTLEVSRGTNSTLTPFIRGIGQQDPVAGFEQGVGLYLDDVYLNRPQAAVLDIYDVQRIEVLRGPQGTLYGRNTVGGAIKYVTRNIPTDAPHASLRTNIGTHGQRDLIGSVSAPITSTIRVGAAVAHLSTRGFGENVTTHQHNYNKNVWAARGTVEFQPSEDTFFRLSGDYTWDNSNPRGGHRLIDNIRTGEHPLSDVFDTEGDLNDPKQKVRAGGVALHGEIGLSDWLKFRTITAYRKDKSATPIDFDATPLVDLDVPAIYKNRQFSQEFQLVADKGPLKGVAGFYYLDANAYDIFDVRLYTLIPGFTASTLGDVDTKTWAAFTDLTYDFSPQWSVSVGGRYTHDHRHAHVLRQSRVGGGQPGLGGVDGFGVGTVIATTSDFTGSRTDKAFTPRASINFKPDANNNLYLSYSKGFKGGGFDPRTQSSQAPSQSPEDVYNYMAFKPEKVDSFEAGWKAALFDRRLQLATALFDAEYKDVQVPGSAGCVIAGQANFCGVTTNAGKARFRGAELETNWRLAQNLVASGDRLSFAGTLGYLDAKYIHFVTNIPGNGPVDVASDRKIQNTPKWTLSGSLDYDTPLNGGRLNLNTTVSYRSSSQQFEIATPMLDQPGFALWDANIVWRSAGNRFQIGLHGKNLANKKYIVSGYNFLTQDPYTGDFITGANGHYIPAGGLGSTGVLTGFYGNPRQIWASLGVNF